MPHESNKLHPLGYLIRRAIHLNPGVQGFMDWNTGAIRLNCAQEEYARRVTIPSSAGGIREVYIHEHYHFAQALICGFVYCHCAKLKALVDAVLFKDFDEKAMRNLLDEFIRSRSLMYDSTAAGISAYEIIEGLTYYLDSTAFSDEPPTRFIDFIPTAPVPDLYKRCYLKAYSEIGSEVYGFPFICHLSLCFESPAVAFAGLLGKWKKDFDGDTPLPAVRDMCKNSMTGFIGFSWEQPLSHPIYDAILSRISSEGADESFCTAFMNPRRVFDPGFLKYISRPIILNPSSSKVNPFYNDYHIANAKALGPNPDLNRFYAEFSVGSEVSRDPGVISFLIERQIG